MKVLIFGLALMFGATQASAGEVFEIVSLKFKEDVSLNDQRRLMKDLNEVVQKLEGFKSRDYYYSTENGRWIDFVVWTDLRLAKKASEDAMKNAKAQAVISKIDERSMIFSHYERVGRVKKD